MVSTLLLDLDNTLYEYEPAHKKGIKAVEDYFTSRTSRTTEEFNSAFALAKEKVKQILLGRAASHNRLLYFQTLCEILQVPVFDFALQMYNLYWETFLEGARLRESVLDFFELNRSKKIVLVTDLTAEIQYRKVQQLDLSSYIDFIVTSEEAGCEKPHPWIFSLALLKTGEDRQNAIMIGDDYRKDILGARNLGIKPYWFTQHPDNERPNGIEVFESFTELGKRIHD